MDAEDIAKHAFEKVEETREAVEKLAQHPLGKKIIRTIINESGNTHEKVAQARNVLDRALGTASSSNVYGDAFRSLDTIGTALTLPFLGYQGYQHLKDISEESSPPSQSDLDRVLEQNPRIERQYNDEEIKKYFQSIAKHAPTFVKNDPHMTGKILEQMLGYEGADVQTLNKLLEAEGQMTHNRRERVNPETLNKTLETLSGMSKESVEQSPDDDFERLKSLLDDKNDD